MLRIAPPIALVILAAPVQAQGAIFTSTKTADAVNENVYKKKTDVYLNGGPINGNCGEGGLADGYYYFQVTNPSGTVLLSADAVANREVLVAGGVIVATSGSHKVGAGICGSASIQLHPFDDSPNREYKVWLTPVADYQSGSGSHGFLSKHSKTDNFKIKGPGKPVDQGAITGIKFFDRNENRIQDADEPVIPGWRIEIFKDGIREDFTFTDESGKYEFIRPIDGTEYLITEEAPDPGFIPAVGGIWLATTDVMALVTADQEAVDGPDFGNVSFSPILGAGRSKGFWHGPNGKILLEACDPDWRDAINALCLRHPDGSIFTVPTEADFETAFALLSDFLVDPVHGSAANQLSTQLAAAVLSNVCGFMPGTIFVDIEQDGVLVSFAGLVAGAVALLCDPGVETGDPDLIEDIRNCTNEFEDINNTGDLSNPQIVNGISEEPEGFESPYGEGTGGEE